MICQGISDVLLHELIYRQRKRQRKMRQNERMANQNKRKRKGWGRLKEGKCLMAYSVEETIPSPQRTATSINVFSSENQLNVC